MILPQPQLEATELMKNFDKDFFDFLADYERTLGEGVLDLENKDFIEDYIKNIKEIIKKFS